MVQPIYSSKMAIHFWVRYYNSAYVEVNSNYTVIFDNLADMGLYNYLKYLRFQSLQECFTESLCVFFYFHRSNIQFCFLRVFDVRLKSIIQCIKNLSKKIGVWLRYSFNFQWLNVILRYFDWKLAAEWSTNGTIHLFSKNGYSFVGLILLL